MKYRGQSKPSDIETPAPNLVVMRDRIIIQEHHHGETNKYMWESSNIADHYSKVCNDFNNAEFFNPGEETKCNNHRP